MKVTERDLENWAGVAILGILEGLGLGLKLSQSRRFKPSDLTVRLDRDPKTDDLIIDLELRDGRFIHVEDRKAKG